MKPTLFGLEILYAKSIDFRFGSFLLGSVIVELLNFSASSLVVDDAILSANVWTHKHTYNISHKKLQAWNSQLYLVRNWEPVFG